MTNPTAIDQQTVKFGPNQCLHIDDIMIGFRKIVITDESGVMYFDFHNHPDKSMNLPSIIYASLNPELLGDPVTWACDLEAKYQGTPRAAALISFHDQLTNLASERGLDFVTILRATYYAYKHNDLDIERALAASDNEEAQILSARNKEESIVNQSLSKAN